MHYRNNIDSEDDFHSGCRNVSHNHQQSSQVYTNLDDPEETTICTNSNNNNSSNDNNSNSNKSNNNDKSNNNNDSNKYNIIYFLRNVPITRIAFIWESSKIFLFIPCQRKYSQSKPEKQFMFCSITSSKFSMISEHFLRFSEVLTKSKTHHKLF